MDRIKQFIRLEEDEGNTRAAQPEAPVLPPNSKSLARTGQTSKVNSVPTNFVAPSFKALNTVFKEPIYRILDKIKGEPFFVWPPKLPGDSATRNQKLRCSYHRDKGHLTENCYKLKTHLEQLVSDGHLSEYVDLSLTDPKKPKVISNRSGNSGAAPTGVIHVILNALCTSILSASFRSDLQKATHLRQSYGILDSAHLAPTHCSDIHSSLDREIISFSDSDLKDVQLPHSDPLVITLRIGNYDVKRVLVDQGSFAKVMYQELYEKLGLGESDLTEFTSPVFGFSGESTVPLGKTIFPMLTGPVNLQTEFIVIQAPSPYNAIMGRGWLHRMKAVPSTLHQKLRFPTKDGVMEVNGDQVAAKQCVLAAIGRKALGKVGRNLPSSDRDELVTLLLEFLDVFAWSVYKAPGVSPDLACHSLGRSSDFKPVIQKRRKLAPKRLEINMEEVERLITADAVRLVQYTTWLSNTVVVKKKNGKWRVCVDFTDLNKACPKDSFPLSRIDQLVDSASGHERMSFLDAFQGYHQIPMTLSDQEKTAFITPQGVYYYRVMLFGLKNARVTYQRIVTTMFGNQIGKTVEVYIDDMLVKSVRKEDHLSNLKEAFEILRRDKLRLNVSKCLFGISSGKFLGHIISDRGIEANLDQISASADKCRPFFRLLGKKRKFLWDEDCSAAFQGIKAYLSSPPYISIPSSGEPLYLYLAVSEYAVSAILVWETSEDQKPIFFISKTMNEAESRYLSLEKAALALVRSAKKLPQHFQANGECSLDLLGVEYKPGTSIKGQVLANFIAEFQGKDGEVESASPFRVEADSAIMEWKLFVDSASNTKGSGTGAIAKRLGADRLLIFCDSQLVANQISGEYQAWDERMMAYLLAVRASLSKFEFTQMEQIGREHNSHADVLAKLATVMETNLQRTVTIETYMRDDQLPEDQKAASIIKRKAPDLMNNLLFEIHESICGSHTGGRSLAHRAMSQGYWWPYMQSDAVRVITRFGIPRAVLSDNGTQFEGKLFKGFCSDLGIRNFFSSSGYPQANGQAEVLNKVILDGIKKRLEAAKGKWVEELPSVLWTHRTTHRRSTGETPFSLAYGIEVVIPLEIRLPMIRTTEFDTEQNEDNLRMDLNLIEERRDLAMIRLASYQRQMKRGYDKNIKPRSFQIGDLVLRKVVANTRNLNDGKLRPNWEGPYKVVSFTEIGSYILENMDGKPIPRPWNICNLKKYFF
uniref:Integrase catalytic domain-containing protein n=1 Tax=Fagus sylvatica TaxID=28930 RepID=A0A2N9ILK1_FAGSY